METIFESLARPRLEVKLELPPPNKIEEKCFRVLPVLSEKEILEIAENKKANLFAGPLGFRKPKPAEVKFRNIRKFFKPYWHLKACYKCRWLNLTSYPVPVPEDVIAIKFEDKIIKVKKEALSISDMLNEIGIGISLGPLTVTSRPVVSSLLKPLGGDKTVGSKRHIVLENVIELREDSAEAEVCLAASNGKEDEEAQELITKANAEEIQEWEKPKISKAYALKKLKEKFDDIEERIETEAETIIERKISVTEARIVLVPWYEIKYECNQSKRSWLINAVNGEMKKAKV